LRRNIRGTRGESGERGLALAGKEGNWFEWTKSCSMVPRANSMSKADQVARLCTKGQNNLNEPYHRTIVLFCQGIWNICSFFYRKENFLWAIRRFAYTSGIPTRCSAVLPDRSGKNIQTRDRSFLICLATL
jgi:hypothetical protein